MTVTERTHATCEACGQGYSVPDQNRTYTCKLCQGTVRVPGEGMSSHGHLEDAIDCEECHAINHAGTETCVECGADLTESEDEEPEFDEAKARRQATNALRRGYKWVDAFRWVSRAGALGYALVTIMAIVAMSRSEIPYEDGLLVVVVSTLLTMLMMMGSVQILFKPFVWTLLIAAVATVASVIHFVGPNPLDIASLWSAFWAVLFWVAIPPTLGFRKLIAAHTDLYILQRSSQRTRRRIENDTSGHRHQRLLRVMRKASQRAWRISAGIAIGATLVSAIATYVVVSEIRPEDLHETISSFEEDWRRSSKATLRKYFAPEIRTWQTDRLFGFAAGHGWGSRFPALGDRQLTDNLNEAIVKYQLGDLPITMLWALRERDWVLLQITMPAPPFEPAFKQFMAAWKNTDVERMSKFFVDEFQERMVVSLNNTLVNRNWKAFPKVLSRDFDPSENEKMVVTLQVELGTVIANWWITPQGSWGLQSIVFPDPPKKIRKRPR